MRHRRRWSADGPGQPRHRIAGREWHGTVRIRRTAALAVVAAGIVLAAGAVVAAGVPVWPPGSPPGAPRHDAAASTFVPLPPDSSAPFPPDLSRSEDRERASRDAPRRTPSPPPRPIPPAPQSSTVAPAPAGPPPSGSAGPTSPPASPSETPTPSATPTPDPTATPTPSPQPSDGYVAIGPSFSGMASFYGDGDGTDGGTTASGETFDANAMTAASPSLPFGTLLNVCYQGRCVVVRINDRGPFVAGRILDLSAGAAEVIGMRQVGVAFVTATPVKPAA